MILSACVVTFCQVVTVMFWCLVFCVLFHKNSPRLRAIAWESSRNESLTRDMIRASTRSQKTEKSMVIRELFRFTTCFHWVCRFGRFWFHPGILEELGICITSRHKNTKIPLVQTSNCIVPGSSNSFLESDKSWIGLRAYKRRTFLSETVVVITQKNRLCRDSN